MTQESTQVPLPLRVRDVFVPGGFPRYTYQDRQKYGIEATLRDALDRLNKFIAVAGPTKSGKTVLVRKIVPKHQCIWLEGGHVASIQDVWDAVMSELHVPTQRVESASHQAEEGSSSALDAGIKPLGMGGGLSEQKSQKESKSRTSNKTFATHSAKAAVDALLDARRVLVIDDFHYIDANVQSDIVRALKPGVFEGLQVVLILIPHRMHEAAQAEIDVDGRTVTVKIPDWQPDELFKIAEDGFVALKVDFLATTIDTLIKESFGSPHIMQDFCSNLCKRTGISEQFQGSGTKPVIRIPEPPENFFKEFADSISPEAFKALRKGPERTNRKDRALVKGGTCDTYEAILLALHELGGTTPVDWTRLRRALQAVLSDVPQQNEITRALEKMDEIAKQREGEPVIDYLNGELHLVDPFFRYYLKWNSAIVDSAGSSPATTDA